MNHSDLRHIIEQRFVANMHRHPEINFDHVFDKLSLEEHRILLEMEKTGGEPDFVLLDHELFMIDMAKETPKSRRSLCYDKIAREGRKKFPPVSSASEMAMEIGITLVDESMYRAIQEMEDLDTKTSSWIYTPPAMRSLGGALFGDKRFERTFLYHNGADAYYSGRGFRGYIKLSV